MHTIYICNSMGDIAAFIKMFPEACWSNESLLDINNDFNLYKQPPIALYRWSNTNLVSWSAVSYAVDYLQFNSANYTLGTLQPLLDLASVFVAFLKHNDAYNKYVDRFDPAYSNNVNLQADKLIFQAFYWHTSYESGCYWKDLDTKWENLLNHFGIDPTAVLANVFTTVKECK